jgi:hypothetical protein
VACLGCGFLIPLPMREARRELDKIDKAWKKLVAALNAIKRK